jgi:adenine-specific DNA glycosylase
VAVLRGAFWIEDARGRVLLRKLPAGEANAGLWEPPGATAHHSERDAGAAPPALAGGELARRAAERLHGATGLAVDPGRRLGRVQHAITHHRITVHLFAARSRGGVADTLEWRWAEPTRADGLALTSAGARMMRLGAVAQSDAAGS